MKKIVLFAAAGLMSLAACQEKAGYIIKGTAEGVADGDTVFLQKQTEEGFEALDSVVVKNGTFEFKGTPDSVAVSRFVTYMKGDARMAAMVFVEKGNIQVNLSPMESRISGTPNNDTYQKFMDEYQKIGKEMNDMYQKIKGDTLLTEVQRDSLMEVLDKKETEGMDSISLSANWMWPCRSQEGEDARLYTAVKALSDFCCSLQINVPTGKDSLSMTQKYPDGSKVISPGTVIVSAGGEVSDVKKVVSPVLVNNEKTTIYHIDFSFDNLKLGGSAFAQTLGKVGDEVPSVQDAEYFRDAFLAVQELVNKGLILAGHDISAGGLITTLLEMCFANVEGGMEINLDKIKEQDLIKILFAENPGIVIQVSDKHKEAVKQILEDAGVGYVKLGKPTDERHILVSKGDVTYQFGIDYMRDVWYSTSYLLDRKQSMNGCAKKRFENYKMQPVEFAFMPDFKGKFSQYGINPDRRTPSGIRAAIIREKGTNGEREMAYSLYLAGFDVKDVTMTDLISGRETLEDVNMIVYCGGFSNSDVLGSAKGWAGAFLFNPKAKEALDKYYAREDTLSLGVCNGCQLMMELNLINPEHKKNGKMLHNDSHKFESRFLGVTVPTNRSVMLGSLSGSKLGIWVAHGEGKFSLPYDEDKYNVVLKYSYDEYPSNPNGSDYSIAGLASADGRHLAMMPHLERAIFPWQNGCYPADRVNSDQITPWVEAFVNARKWVEANKK